MKNFKNLWSQKSEIRDYNNILITPEKIVKINPDSQVVLKNNNIYVDSPIFVDMGLFLKIYDPKNVYLYENNQLIRGDGIKYKLPAVNTVIQDDLLINIEFQNCYTYESIKELYFNINKKYQGTTRDHLYSVCFNKNQVAIADVRFFSVKYTDSELQERLVIPYVYFEHLKDGFALSYTDKIVRIEAGDEAVYFKKTELLNNDYPDYESVIPDYTITPSFKIDKKFITFLKECKKLKLDNMYINNSQFFVASDKVYNDDTEFEPDATVVEYQHNIENVDRIDNNICFNPDFILNATGIIDTFFINTKTRPSVAKKGDEYLFIIMPLRA